MQYLRVMNLIVFTNANVGCLALHVVFVGLALLMQFPMSHRMTARYLHLGSVTGCS